jgi:DNA-3-methyladenine glycosylase II
MAQLQLLTPREFSFELALQFLKRSPKEVLHRVEDNAVIKLLRAADAWVLFSLSGGNGNLAVEFLNGNPPASTKKMVSEYVVEWFDLETNLVPFYKLAKADKLLKDLVKQYYGYRIIGQPDLFESLVWAVLGQQINVQFAYTLKQRFVEKFGETLVWNNKPYYVFPSAERVASLTDADLLPLQFSRQKSKYTVLIAQAFTEGLISKDKLRGLPLQEAKEALMTIKGVGNWTANYALMKTYRYPDAFPLEDAGIHNAIKNLLKLRDKPSLDRVKKIYKAYRGWEAYATLYLWKSL